MNHRFPSSLAKAFSLLILSLVLAMPSWAITVTPFPSFSKTFAPETIAPGNISRLVFTITTDVESAPASGLAFTDTLPSGLIVATPARVVNGCGGIVTAEDGGVTITLSDGQLGSGSSCEIAVDVTGATGGIFTNTTGDLTSDVGNSGAASAVLTIDTYRPRFTKSFDPVTVSPGQISTLTFTIDNSFNEVDLLNIQFSDSLPPGMVIAFPDHAVTTCGTVDNTPTITAVPGGTTISYTYTATMYLPAPPYVTTVPAVIAGENCTFSVDITPTEFGKKTNVSSELTSDTGAASLSSGYATAVLDVPYRFLTKTFYDHPVAPGDTATLRFTLFNSDRSNAATNISFTDDLDAMLLFGLTSVGLPITDPCGTGSQLSGTGSLSFSGGSLGPEGSCFFDVTIQVPGGATSGIYLNTTSSVTYEQNGDGVVGLPASDSLIVQPVPILTKQFIPNPVGAGDLVDLEFTITNSSATSTASEIAFIDNLTAVFPGWHVGPMTLPDFPCGFSSTLTNQYVTTDTYGLALTGGELAPNASCTFTAQFTVPAGTSPGSYENVTDPVTATIDSTTHTGLPATDTLLVVAAPTLNKEFIDDPVLAGSTVNLQFTLSHDEFAADAATFISFTDDLATTTLAGFSTDVDMPQTDVCGVGSQFSISGDILSLTGGTLNPGETCSFGLPLIVPGNAAHGSYTNTTSDVSATVGVAVTGLAATDDLFVVNGATLSKSFTDDPKMPGETVTLEYTIENTNPTAQATAISFSDSLSGIFTGLEVIPASIPLEPCGTGSSLLAPGNTFLLLTGGILDRYVLPDPDSPPPAGPTYSCTFSVTLQIPADALDGSFNSASSNLTFSLDGAGSFVSPPAIDILEIVPIPPPPTPDQLAYFNNGEWYIDANNNYAWDAGDVLYQFDPFTGGTPVPGDWDGNGTLRPGMFQIVGNVGSWALDTNGNGVWDGDGGPPTNDNLYVWPVLPGDRPVVGDWDGDGTDDLGLFRVTSTETLWLLDASSNRVWDGGAGLVRGEDDIYHWPLTPFGPDLPVIGDWNNDGTDDLGVFRAKDSEMVWRIDSNSNRQWDSPQAVLFSPDSRYVWPLSPFGPDLPVVGDWDGDSIQQFGVYREKFGSQMLWRLDLNGNFTWDRPIGGDERVLNFGNSDITNVPVPGAW